MAYIISWHALLRLVISSYTFGRGWPFPVTGRDSYSAPVVDAILVAMVT